MMHIPGEPKRYERKTRRNTNRGGPCRKNFSEKSLAKAPIA
jgi:hypothetical protein